MSSAKGESSSRRKGKKDATDDLPIEAVGGKAPHSESNHFEEEVRGHDTSSECPPIIDPWYDTYIHFSMVSDNYLPPLLGRVWLSLYHCDSEVSWAPLASSIPNLDICQGTLLPVPILFEFRSGTSLGWKDWVDTELSDVGFMIVLQRAGILMAIVSS